MPLTDPTPTTLNVKRLLPSMLQAAAGQLPVVGHAPHRAGGAAALPRVHGPAEQDLCCG